MRLSLVVLACLASGAAARPLGGLGGRTETQVPLSIARQEVGAARIEGTVYVVGGLVEGFQATATVEALDLASGTWSQIAPLPNTLHHMGVAAHGGKLYAFGGYLSSFVPRAQCLVYDPATNAWSPIAPLPSARGACWAVTHGERIYVFGGQGPAGTSRTTFVYDPAAGSWSQGADMPTVREHLNAVALGDFVYVIGGRAGASTGANERYHPATNSWSALTPMPTARSASALAALDGRIFAMGGEIPQLFALNEVYDPASDSWSRQADMVVPRHGVAAVALEDEILMAAGGVIQGLAPTAHVDAFFPEPASAVRSCFCGASAPCGNTDAVAGCASSTGSGGRLAASGRPSVSLDSFALHACDLPASAVSIYVQGSALAPAAPFGDGLLCLSGAIRRLAPRVSQGGASTLPGAGQMPLSVLGQAQAGQTLAYQVWFRNPLGPCGMGSNLTHALAIDWEP